MSLARLTPTFLTIAFLLAPVASAQLDLPKAPEESGTTKPRKADKPKAGKQDEPKKRQRGNLVQHLICSVCFERNYTAPLSAVNDQGLADVFCGICRRNTLHKPSSKEKGSGALDLPSFPPVGSGAGAESGAAAESDGGRSAGQPQVVPGVASDRAASFILTEVRKTRSLDDSLGLRAVDSLVALGEPGLIAAREALADDEPVICMCAARVLLRSAEAEDRQRVVNRLRGRVPGRVGPKLLSELVKADPVHGGPRLLADLLDHPHTSVRAAAYRELHDQMSPELLDEVARALKSKRASTRSSAVELLGRLEDVSTTAVLLPYLSDSSASVASGVAGALALSTDESIDAKLLSVAFGQRWILRESSYALLAIVQREDANLTAILSDSHAPALLRGLESADPFVSGTCATALAGIGFRSPDVVGSTWLERKVPERLITAVSGKTFHADFASLQPHALRRLRLITGKELGNDGQAWVKWWIANHNQFYPNRAHLFVDPERVGTLAIHYRSFGSLVDSFSLVGADLAEAAYANPTHSGEQLFLTRGECADLLSLLRSEGVLGAERLPGVLGARGSGERSLEVVIDGHGKKFLLGEGRNEPWFDRVSVAVQAMRERCAWQRYPDPAQYENSFAMWKAEGEWWSSAERTPKERALRAKSHLMSWLSAQRVTQRTGAIRDLAELYQINGVAEPSDFAYFRDRIREENFFGPRAEELLELSLEAGRLAGKKGHVAKVLGAELAQVLSSKFGSSAAQEIAEVVQSCGPEYVLEVSAHEVPMMRAVAASVLARSDRPEDRARLLELLDDPEENVQIATMLVLGEQQVEEARTELLVRARFAPRAIRVGALQSIARLGGEFVFDALVAGRSDPDPFIREASVEGLAILGDPRAAPLLISLLAKGEESSTFDLAWNGLLRMGKEAHTDLLQAMYSPTHRARRQATFLLSRQLQPEAASTLIAMLTDAPADRAVARELAVLTSVDFSGTADSSLRWWDWWDEVVHDDSLAWFRGALERLERTPPEAECFRADGNLEGALYLVSLLPNELANIAERARRELEIMLARELPAMPHDELERESWLEALRQVVLAHWEA